MFKFGNGLPMSCKITAPRCVLLLKMDSTQTVIVTACLSLPGTEIEVEIENRYREYTKMVHYIDVYIEKTCQVK